MNLDATENYGQENQGFQNNDIRKEGHENEKFSADHSITNNAEPDYGNEFSSDEFKTDELGNENLGDDELNNEELDRDAFETEDDDEFGNEESDNEGLDDIDKETNLDRTS